MLQLVLFNLNRFSRHPLVLFFVLFPFCLLKAQPSIKGSKEKSSFSARLMNIEAAANETFRYNTSLHNGGTNPMVYALKADLPPGWLITFRVDGSQVRSLNLEAGASKDISIEINSSATAKPDTYKVPVKAISASDTLLLNLEAVVKGAYEVELTTPSGRLSEEVTSGSQKEIHLVLKNPGTLPLNDLEFSSQLPSKWEATFEPSKINQLEPGKTLEVTVKLSVPDKTIAGDYATTFTVRNANANTDAAFRMVVKTSLLSGWIGIVVILLAVGLVYSLVRKYGRR